MASDPFLGKKVELDDAVVGQEYILKKKFEEPFNTSYSKISIPAEYKKPGYYMLTAMKYLWKNGKWTEELMFQGPIMIYSNVSAELYEMPRLAATAAGGKRKTRRRKTAKRKKHASYAS